jgi:iron complex transport system substrate-binding protein
MPETDILPKKIISLAPALTETLFALKMSHRVAGITDSCDYPAQVKDWPNVACWFDPDLAKLYALKPDLVLGLETAHGRLKQKLELKGIRVILVNPITVDETLDVIAGIGDLLGVSEKAAILVMDLRNRLSALDARVNAIPKEDKITAARILDMEDSRFHVAGPLSFQYDIISRAGGQNVTGSIHEAYPKVTLTQLRQWDPQVLFSCGFDLSSIPQLAQKSEWRSLRAVQSGKIFVFDCDLTCRAGPRIVDMVELLFKALYADRMTKKI